MKLKLILASALFMVACGSDPEPKSLNGESCDKGSDCLSNDCRTEMVGCNPFLGCSTFVLTDGMCTNECMWDESAEDPLIRVQGTCETGEHCLIYGDSPQLCFQACGDAGECAREDYQCFDLGGGIEACLPPQDI